MIAVPALSLSTWGKLAGGALCGALLAFGPVYLIGKSAGKTETEAAAARQALDRIEQMEKNNASFKNLSNRDRCIVFMRDSRLPISECD